MAGADLSPQLPRETALLVAALDQTPRRDERRQSNFCWNDCGAILGDVTKNASKPIHQVIDFCRARCVKGEDCTGRLAPESDLAGAADGGHWWAPAVGQTM